MIHSSHPGTMIFHHPGPIYEDARAGSQVRPKHLLQAFGALGYEVVTVVGYGTERRRTIRRVLDDLSRGRRYDFIYSESRSIPTLLTEQHHFPRFPLMDFRFLSTMRKSHIKVGLFYRDVFWRFSVYRKMLSGLGRMITVPLYWYDWWWYRYSIDHLFLPSMGMARFLPTGWFDDKCSALPPGTIIPSMTYGPKAITKNTSSLRLLYVGGIEPPTYNLRPLLVALKQLPNIDLALCCRASDWQKNQSFYADWMTDRIEILHLSGDALTDQYARSDVFGLLREPGEYLDFAVPVKLFESVGHGLPIITLRGTEAARIVETEGFGWAFDNIEQASRFLIDLLRDRRQLEIVREQVLKVRECHAWSQRARQIAKTLS